MRVENMALNSYIGILLIFFHLSLYPSAGLLDLYRLSKIQIIALVYVKFKRISGTI